MKRSALIPGKKFIQGLVVVDGIQYVFRTAHGYEAAIWAWRTHDSTYYWRQTTYKWERMPKGAVIEMYDLEDPPATVSYIPTLN